MDIKHVKIADDATLLFYIRYIRINHHWTVGYDGVVCLYISFTIYNVKLF